MVEPAEITASVGRAKVAVGTATRDYSFVVSDGQVSLARNGTAANFAVAPQIESAGAKDASEAGGAGRITAPLPGLISQLNVTPGQTVTQGDTVIVLEAMKLMYSLPAQISGIVTEILCKAGESVAAGASLVEISPVA